MTQIDTLTTMLTSQTMKLMEAEKKLVDQKERFMTQITYLTDMVVSQQQEMAKQAAQKDAKVERCMK